MADDQKDLVALNAARRALGGGGDSPLPAGAGSLQRQADQLAGMGDWGPSAEDVNRRMIERAGLQPFTEIPDRFWGASR